MHILLINTNPVVSRLLALCARDDSIILEEVASITSLKRKDYDIVFVDEESYKDEVLDMNRYISSSKKVFFSNEDIQHNIFDMVIKKPFLPSEIIALFDTVEENDFEYEKSSKQGFIFPLSTETVERDIDEETQVLDAGEVEKIKTLLEMDEDTEIDVLNDDEIEARKIEVIKEQLIADGLEIVDEDEIVDELSMQDAIKIFDISEKENSTKSKKVKKSKVKKIKSSKSKKKKNIHYTEAQRTAIKDAIKIAIGKVKRKKMKKLLKGKEVKLHIQLKAKA